MEYLVGNDGVISFLEVNTRLQVEHPVSEMTTGLDLVREQFRIAEGEVLRFTEDPEPRGHAFEFRINGEDPGRNFLPAPGTVTAYREPGRPGCPGRFRDRAELGGRRRIRFPAGQADRLGRVPVGGAGPLPAGAGRIRRRRDGHRAAVPPGRRPGSSLHREPFTVFTQWIETEFDNQLPAFAAAAARRSASRCHGRPSWSR